MPDEYKVYGVDEFGKVSGEEDMLQEIYQRGPIACSIASTEVLEDYKGGILNDSTPVKETNHVVSIVGFGEESG